MPITQKLQVIYGRSTYQTSALLSKMSIFCVRAGCKKGLVSYGSKHALQSLSDKPFVHTYITHLTWKLQVVPRHSTHWTTAQLSETFVVWYRDAWEIWPESYGPRHALVVFWYNIVCVFCKPIHTLLFSTQLRMTTKLMYTYLMTAYYTPNDSFPANAASSFKNKVV